MVCKRTKHRITRPIRNWAPRNSAECIGVAAVEPAAVGVRKGFQEPFALLVNRVVKFEVGAALTLAVRVPENPTSVGIEDVGVCVAPAGIDESNDGRPLDECLSHLLERGEVHTGV